MSKSDRIPEALNRRAAESEKQRQQQRAVELMALGPDVIELAEWSADIVELVALRGRAAELQIIAGARGVELPVLGRSIRNGEHLALCVRPNRWLILTTPSASLLSRPAIAGFLSKSPAADALVAAGGPAAEGGPAAAWSAACAGAGIAIDLSSALSAFHLSGAAAHEVVARNCRVDLDVDLQVSLDADLQAARRLRASGSPEEHPTGTAIATIMAQVSVVLTQTDSGILLLTPATTARHFSEWLAAALPGDPLP